MSLNREFERKFREELRERVLESIEEFLDRLSLRQLVELKRRIECAKRASKAWF